MSGKIFEGIVTSTKMEKTLVVRVLRKFSEERMGKIVSRNKNYKVHCVDSSVNEGDRVTFVGTAPISKEKKYRFLKVTHKVLQVENSNKEQSSEA